MKTENKPTAKDVAEKMIKGEKEKVGTSPKKSAKVTNKEEEAMLDAQTEKLKAILQEVTEKKELSFNMLESLKKVQENAGTAQSQEILDKLIAMQKAKSEGKLEEFFEKELGKQERGNASKDVTALTKNQKRAIHTFLKETIGCDEYIVVALTEYDNGLQTEVLTQLHPKMIQAVLGEIIESIKKGKGEQVDLSVKE